MVRKKKLYTIIIVILTLFIANHSYAEFMPAGFEDLSTEEEGEVTVYYNGKAIGRTAAVFDDDFFEFLDKQFLINKLTFTKNPTLTTNYFMKRLDPHVDLICYEKNITKCPFLSPKSVAVIFDRDEYKVHLYINASLLKPAVAEKYHYIKTTATPLGNINRFNMIANATKNERKLFFTNTSVLSKNNKSLVLKSHFTTFINPEKKTPDHNQFRIDDMDYELAEKNYILRAGFIENNSILFIPSFNLFGVSRDSKNTYLKNQHVAFGMRVEVNLDAPSLIEVSKGDQLIYSKFKPTGNYFLNTKDFPNGFYNITIIITSLYGKETTRRQLFIKNDAIPALGHPLWYISAGAQSIGYTSDRAILPTMSKQYIGTTIYKYRLNRKSDLELGALASSSYQLLTAGYGLFGSRYNLSLDMAVDSDYDLGIGGTYSVAFHNLNMNAYSRYFIIRHHQQTPSTDNPTSEIDIIKQAKAENGLSIGYNLLGGQLNANVSTFNNQDNKNETDYGLVYRRNIYKKHDLNIDLQANMSTSDAGHVYLLTLNFAFKHHDIIHNAKFEMEHAADNAQGSPHWTKYFDYNVSHTRKHKLHKKIDFSLDTKANRQSYQIDGTLNTSFKDISLSGNIAYTNTFQNPKGSYIADFNVNNTKNLGLAVNKHGFAWSSDMSKTTGISVKINSAHRQHTFAVMLDGQEYPLKANHSLLLPVSPLQPHDLEVIPNSLSSTIPNNQQSFTLNIHNLKSYQFEEKDIFMLMGNVVTEDDSPVTKAFVDGAVMPGETDDEGFFDADVYTNSTIKLERPNGQSCWIDTSQFKPEEGMVYADEIFCLPKTIK